MTDDKPKTPGMAEVSAKFVHEPTEEEAERKARVKARDEIDAVLAKLPPRGDAETQIEGVYRKVLALRENPPPRGSDEGMNVWVKEHDDLEEAIGILRAENLHDVEIKLAILCYRLRENIDPGEQASSADFIIALAAQDDLRRIAGERSATALEDPVLALEERDRITNLWDAYKGTGATLTGMKSEYLAAGDLEAAAAEDKAGEADSAAFAAILNERCHTLGGVLAKMSVLKGEAAEVEMSTDLFDAIVRDLERMSDVVSPQRSPLFSHVFNMEPPITEAEGAVAALELLVQGGGLANVEEAVIYLVGQLRQHIKEERHLFTTLFTAASGSET